MRNHRTTQQERIIRMLLTDKMTIEQVHERLKISEKDVRNVIAYTMTADERNAMNGKGLVF